MRQSKSRTKISSGSESCVASPAVHSWNPTASWRSTWVVDAELIDSVRIGLEPSNGESHGDTDGGVPPAQICTQHNEGVPAYEECDPPGVTRPCIPITPSP